MKQMVNVILVIILLCCLFSCSKQKMPATVFSPDNTIQVVFDFDGEGKPFYSVKKDDDVVLLDSYLKLELGEKSEDKQLFVTEIERTSVDENYDIIVGKAASARNNYNEVIIEVKTSSVNDPSVQYIFRIYNDGVAYRTVLNSAKGGSIHVINENNEYNFASDVKCWALKLKNFNTNYENIFTETWVDSLKMGEYIGLPLTLQFNENLYGCIAEASLVDYAGMYIEGNPLKHNSLITKLSPHPDSPGYSVIGDTTIETPWRVIILGNTPGDLIESNLITNLNEPCAIEDPSWIKPGKSAWDWWSGAIVEGVDFEGGMNTETMKYYIDFAEEFNLEYMLIDAGWYGSHKDETQDITTTIPEIDMPAIVSYAKDKGVDVLIWLNWKNTSKQMDEAFALYERWGIKGVKVDYMNRDHQEMVRFYEKMIKKAAEHHLLIDLHGSYKPTGYRRTYPNFITCEGVYGLENSRSVPKLNPEHNVTLPFTRMLVGPMDYTPGAFRNVKKEDHYRTHTNPVAIGSRCHQLAMFVVYDSPLQTVADHPAAYKGEPGAEFIKAVPASWDETIVLSGEIGNYIVVARRLKDKWYLGAMTDYSPRELEVNLDFLGVGDYQIKIFSDDAKTDDDPKHVCIKSKEVISSEKLTIKMVSGGGYAAILTPKNN